MLNKPVIRIRPLQVRCLAVCAGVVTAGLGGITDAAVLFTDDFANSGSPDASAHGWYYAGDFNANTLPAVPPDNYLRATDATLDRSGFYKAFDEFTLGIGDRVVVEIVFVGSANMANNASNFRLFLGDRPDNVSINANDSMATMNLGSPDGYLFRMATGTDFSGGSIRQADTGDGLFSSALGGVAGGFTSVYSGLGLPDAVSYSYDKVLTLDLRRSGLTTMEVRGSYDYFTDTFYNFNTIELTSSSFTFDTIGFGLNSWGSGNRTIRISSLNMDLTVIPEPTPLFLLSMGLLFAWKLRKGPSADKPDQGYGIRSTV